MTNLLAIEFLNEFSLTKHALDIKFCYACEQNYTQSLRYHTCFYMSGDNKNQFNDMAIQILLDKYSIILNEHELTKLNEWLFDSSRVEYQFFKDIINS